MTPHEADAMLLDALHMRERHQYRPAFAKLQVAAAAGIAGAKMMLGYCYDVGSGVRRDRALALRWYRRAAADGDGVAMGNIGVIYLSKGKTRTAKKWFERAVKADATERLLDLAKILGGPRAEGPAAQSALRRLLRHRNISVADREEAEALLQRRTARR